MACLGSVAKMFTYIVFICKVSMLLVIACGGQTSYLYLHYTSLKPGLFLNDYMTRETTEHCFLPVYNQKMVTAKLPLSYILEGMCCNEFICKIYKPPPPQSSLFIRTLRLLLLF